MSGTHEASRPGGVEQLLVLVIGVAAIAVGLYGGIILAGAGPAYVPLGAAAVLAVVNLLWRPDGSWGARVVWKALWFTTALIALAGVLDLLVFDLF